LRGIERTQLLGGVGQGGNFQYDEERKYVDLNVLREIGEGRQNKYIFQA